MGNAMASCVIISEPGEIVKADHKLLTKTSQSDEASGLSA
jgi:hypothetical protein